MSGATTITEIKDPRRQEPKQHGEADRLEEQVQQTTKALERARAEIRVLSTHLITAQEEERRRIARDLHDDLGQRTAMIGIQLDQVARFVHEAEGSEALSTVRANLAKLATSLEKVSHRLHPSIIVNLGLPAALNQLVDEFNESGGSAKFRDRSAPPLFDPLLGTALYRIAQEALRNVRKHADLAPVRITLTRQRDQIHLSIEDSGPGFDLDASRGKCGLGLLSMRERARLIGGTLMVRSKPGEGTLILVVSPASPTAFCGG